MGTGHYKATLWTFRQVSTELLASLSIDGYTYTMLPFTRFVTPRSIGQRFALTIGVGAGVILIALATANYFSSREILLHQTSTEALEIVHDQIYSINNLVDRIAILPMAIGANQVANGENGGVTVPWLASLLEQCPIKAVFGLFMILDNQDWKKTDSFLWVDRKSWPGSAKMNYDFHDGSHDWYRGAQNKKGAYVTQPYFAEGGSEIEMISITQAVLNKNGAFIGVAGVDVALDEIQKIVAGMRIREFEDHLANSRSLHSLISQSFRATPQKLHESAYLITANGTLIAGPQTSGKLLPGLSIGKPLSLPGIQEILSRPSGSLRINDDSGRILYWAEAKSTGWKLILEIPYSLIVAPARNLAIESIIIGGLGLILLLGVIFALANKVSGPIRELQVVTADFEKGSYEENAGVLQKISKRRDELGRFAMSFSAMVREIHLREKRLSQWNANLEATVEQRTSDLAHAMQAVEKTNMAMAAELAEAEAYARAVLPEKLKGRVTTDWEFEASSQLGGDSFGYHWLDQDHLALYLIDVCGHGVGAALLSVSVVNLLRTTSLTETDFLSPSAVLSSLNETFPMERHNDMYFTAWYGVYTHSTRQIRFACGGHPPAVLITTEGVSTSLSAKGVIIGAFPAVSYESAAVDVPEGSRLYLFSDGVYEIDRPEAAMMSYDEFVKILSESGRDSRLAAVVAEVKRQQGSNSFVDDFSLVEFLFHSDKAPLV